MNWLEPIIGLVLVLLAASLLVFFSLRQRALLRSQQRSLPRGQRRARAGFAFRPIRAMQRLQRAIGLAVEDGSRLHVSLGRSSIISLANAASLVGLSTLERIGMLSSLSDRPPVSTSGEGTLALLSQDTLRAAYRIGNVPDQFDAAQARLAGPTPFSYAAGVLPVIHDERVSANILVGGFGPEVGLMVDSANREGAFSLGATDSIAGQSVLYAAATEPLIGEELFAVPAYLQPSPVHLASLRVQDVLRWLVILALVVGSVLAFLGIL